MTLTSLSSALQNFNNSLQTQFLLLLFVFGVVYILTTRFQRAKSYDFKRVSEPWVLQMLPVRRRNMMWTIDKCVEVGYYTVRRDLVLIFHERSRTMAFGFPIMDFLAFLINLLIG